MGDYKAAAIAEDGCYMHVITDLLIDCQVLCMQRSCSRGIALEQGKVACPAQRTSPSPRLAARPLEELRHPRAALAEVAPELPQLGEHIRQLQG